MLAEAGGTEADQVKPEVGGACKAWCSWRGGFSTIQKVNKVSVTLLDNWGQKDSRDFTRTIPFDKLSGLMSKAQVDELRAAGRLVMETPRGFHIATTPPELQKDETSDSSSSNEEPKQEDFDAMRASLKAGVQVVTANQLFPTPTALAARMVELAQIKHGQEVLEPSAGTGAIVDAIRLAMSNGTAGRCAIMAVEINCKLAHRLRFNDCLGANRVHDRDFLECNGDLGKFDRIVMNPPFENGSDIKHIKHALTMLKPDGRLVAICANGPRQAEQLKPLVVANGGNWEELPEGTFAGTGVRTVLLTLTAASAPKGQQSLF
jgi:phospholipid N-methyltransferase